MSILGVSNNTPPLDTIEVKRHLSHALFEDQDKRKRLFSHEEIVGALDCLSEHKLRDFYFYVQCHHGSNFALQTAIVSGFVRYAEALLKLRRIDLNSYTATKMGIAMRCYTNLGHRKLSILRLLVEYGAKAPRNLLTIVKPQSIEELHLFVQAGASLEEVYLDYADRWYYFTFYHNEVYQGGPLWDAWGTPQPDLWREYMINGIDSTRAALLLFQSNIYSLLVERPTFNSAVLLAHLYNWSEGPIKLPYIRSDFTYAMFQEVRIITRSRRVICPSIRESARQILHTERMIFMRRHAFRIGVAFQSLELPALVLLEILDATTPTASFVPMHHKWNLIFAIKHSQLN